jgi:hypothetical protein
LDEQPVEMIAHTNEKGEIRPYSFRVQLGDEPLKVIKVDRILLKQPENWAPLNNCYGLYGKTWH